MSEYFPEPKSSGRRMKVELDLSSYARKTELKNETGVDTSSFAKNIDFANSKSDVEKLDIDKLKNLPSGFSSLKSKVDKLDVEKLACVPVALSKLFGEINHVVKKDVYNAKIKNIEDKIPDITNLASNASLNAKINEVNGEIPTTTNFATTAALTTVEDKIPNVRNLVRKTDYNTKVNEIEKKMIIKTNFNNKLLNFSKRINSNKTKLSSVCALRCKHRLCLCHV